MPVQRTLEEDQSIQLNACATETAGTLPPCMVLVNPKRIHMWYIYLLIHQKNQPKLHVAKHKLHGSYGNVLKNLQLYQSNPPRGRQTISELYSPTLNPGSVINGVKWGPKNKGIFHPKNVDFRPFRVITPFMNNNQKTKTTTKNPQETFQQQENPDPSKA